MHNPYSLEKWLGTPQGVDWLAVTVDEYEQKIIRTVGDATEGVSMSLNSWMKDRYNELFNRRNIEKSLEAGMGAIDMSMSALALPLSLPLSVTEQFLRRRLGYLIRRNLKRFIFFFAWRVTLSSMLIELAKEGLRRLAARRGPRCKHAVKFILDASLPLAYCGPAAGIYWGVMRLLRSPVSFCSEEESSSDVGFSSEVDTAGPGSAPGGGQLHNLQEAVALPATSITAQGRKQLKSQLHCSPLSIQGDLLMLGFEMMRIVEGKGLSSWLPVAMQAKKSQPARPIPALVKTPTPQHEKK